MIQISCPHCYSSLKAPEEVIGRRVRCKKCEKPFVAQVADEEPELIDEEPEFVEETPAKTKKPSRPRRDEQDDERPIKRKAALREEDDEDEEPRPRPKKKKGKKKSGSPTLLYALIGGGVLLLAGLGAGSYFLFFKEEDPKIKTAAAAKKADEENDKATAGWHELVENAGKYRIKFPSAYSKMGEEKSGAKMTGYVYEQKSPNLLVYSSMHGIIPPGNPLQGDALLEELSTKFPQAFKESTDSMDKKPITYRGINGREIVISSHKANETGDLVIRIFVTTDRIYIIMAGGINLSANDPKIQNFLASMRFN